MSFNKNNTPPSSSSVSLKLTFPCTDCNFEAQSARQLSRHKAVTHTRNALKCVLCPFVTAYQTNLLRHRKDVHGICGSKGNKSCKFCGFVSEDNDTLIQHQIEIHRDILKSAQAKFAKELLSAGGEECIAEFSANFESMNEDLFSKNPSSSLLEPLALELQQPQPVKKKAKSSASKKSRQSLIVNHGPKLNHLNDNYSNVKNDDERNEFEEFWKAGFVDQYGDHGQYFVQAPILTSLMRNNHNTTIPNQTMNDSQNESVHTSSRSSTPKSQLSSANVTNMDNKTKSNKKNKKSKNLNNQNHTTENVNLPATRIRRQYNCNDCGFHTINPREFLYHRRDMHGYKVKIVECPYCVYACQYVQKLQRHLLLVHKLSSVMNLPSDASNANNANLDCDLERILQKRKYRKSQSIMANNDDNNNNTNHNSNQDNVDMIDDEEDDAEIDDEGDVGDGDNDDDDEDEEGEGEGEEEDDDDDDNERANPNNVDEDVDDDQQSINDPEFEQMKSFEMNLDECSQNDDDMEIDSNNANDEKKFLFNLECFICKIKFGDAISAQKHFLKHHKHSNGKNNNNSSLMMSMMIKNDSANSRSYSAHGTVTANQRKIFDQTAKNIHVCSYCGYKTRWMSELERHIRVHSKEKPFKCPFCDFRSKWKGDLNRHIQRYHSSEQPIPDLESDTSVNGYLANNDGEMSPQDETMNESFMNDDFSDNVDNHHPNNQIDLENDDISSDQVEDENMSTFNGSSAKMYKCTYCNFVCSTASRFHVHYVQHLNTKPFQCSICGHRSNWEWDVTKHIKMKAQRDPEHEKARPVLIHDSGKRDYSKYDKFVVWVGHDEAELVAKEISKIDFRAKRFKNETEDGETNDDNDDDDDDDNDCAGAGGVGPNSGMDSLLTPEVCFEVDGEEMNDGQFSKEPIYSTFLPGGMMIPSSLSRKRSVVKSAIVSRHPNSRTKILKCFRCEFSHRFARVMVAHISSHTEQKPYYCGQCMFETNWREVIINHCDQMHGCDTNPNDFEMHFRCLIDENGVCRIVSDEELQQLIEKQQAATNMLNGINHNHQSNQVASATIPMTVENTLVQSSLIEPNIYEEKAVIRCDHCPFITTNMKKMSIHYRFHNKSKGSLCCKYCPYYVNNRDKLIRHQKLHQTLSNKMDVLVNNTANDINMNLDNQDFSLKKSKCSKLISCSLCPFQTSNARIFGEHMNTHHHSNRMVKNHHIDVGDYLINDSILEQTLLTENDESFDVNPQDSPQDNDLISNTDNNDYGGNANSSNGVGGQPPVSLVNFNNMKNGNGKKFSYVCPECPAAFKSPGDYKMHAVFHSSNYQHSCPYCTYNAKNKPQLCKHLYVHTEEYVAKRANSYPKGTKHLIENQNSGGGNVAINADSLGKKTGRSNFPIIMAKQQQNCGNKNFKRKIPIGSDGKKAHRRSRTKVEFPMIPVKVKLNSEENGKQNIVFNNTDLMASQEFLETKEYLQRINSGIKNRCMYRCSKCPAVFTKVNTLIYHMTLHEQMARISCDHCSYSTEMEDNLGIHSLLHNLTESQTALGYNFNYNCHKCPAGFSKRNRLEKHLSLHGAKFNWKCNKCDYSVRYAATLVKHRALHLINPDFQAIEYDDKNGGMMLPDQNGDSKEPQNDAANLVKEKQLGKNDLKFKLSLSKLKENVPGEGPSTNTAQENMPLVAEHLNTNEEDEDLEENSNLEENASLPSPPDEEEENDEDVEEEDVDDDNDNDDDDDDDDDDEEVDEEDDDDDDQVDGDDVVDQEVCFNNQVSSSILNPVLSLTTDGGDD